MDKPLLYDVYCCAGGTTKGYQKAGFRVIGIDNKPQPHYCGDGFILMDALEFLDRYIAGEFERADVFHASPPCQGYSISKSMQGTKGAEKLIPATRELLFKTGKLFVIENVPGSPLVNPIELSGMSFGLKIIRRRLFELHGFDILLIPSPHQVKNYRNEGYLPYHHGTSVKRGHLPNIWTKPRLQKAMQIEWMDIKEMTQAIPPAYTEFLGKYLMQEVLKIRQLEGVHLA